jgi:hypothetical protein
VRNPDDPQTLLGDIVMYLNCVAIVYLLCHSIYLRRRLVRLNIAIDQGAITASDFAVLARNLPANKEPKELKILIEEMF